MDFLLEEEMIDILTFCLQNPNSTEIDLKKQRLKEIGIELIEVVVYDCLEIVVVFVI